MSAGLLIAFGIDVLVSIIAAVHHYPFNYQGRRRVLDLLSWSSVLWALVLVLAVALIIIPTRITGSNRPTKLGGLLLDIAGFAAAAVVVGAVISLIVNLTLLSGSDLGLARGFAGALSALAAIPIASGAAMWVYANRPRRPWQVGAPPAQYGAPPGQPGGYPAPPQPGGYPPPPQSGGYGQPPG